MTVWRVSGDFSTVTMEGVDDAGRQEAMHWDADCYQMFLDGNRDLTLPFRMEAKRDEEFGWVARLLPPLN